MIPSVTGGLTVRSFCLPNAGVGFYWVNVTHGLGKKKNYYTPVERDGRCDHPRDEFDRNGGAKCKTCFKLKNKLDDARAENIRLKAVLRAAKKVTHKDVVNAHTPSSKVLFRKNSEEKLTQNQGGAKQGHEGSGRESATKENADLVVELPKPSGCPDCNCSLNQRGYCTA